MRKSILLTVLFVFILAGSVFGLDKWEGIVGDGSDQDPYRIQGRTIGVVDDCLVRVFNGVEWVLPSEIIVVGTGSEDNPYRLTNQIEGLVCLPGFSVSKVVLGIQRGQPSGTTTPETLQPIKEEALAAGCISQRCRQIDEVWRSVQGLLERFKTSPNAGKIWDKIRGWVEFSKVYEPARLSRPSEQAITEAGDFLQSSQITKDIAQGLYEQNFAIKVQLIATNLPTNPFYLMAIMHAESKFDPMAVNPKTGATGLIQFTETTASELQTTTAALATMNKLDQLTFVEKYFLRYKGRLNNFGDVAMAVFAPQRGIGKSDDSVVYSSESKGYTNNRGLDKDNNGDITRGEYLCFAASSARRYGITVNC